MPIAINGSGTVTGISVGGLPDGIVDADMLAANAVTTAKISDSQITEAKLATDQQQGLAKAWINLNGTGTVAIRDSFNVTSITDNGTGDYTINFTNALANANYVVTGSSGGANSTSNGAVYQYDQATAKTTSACRIITISSSGGFADTPQIAIAFFGD